MTAKTDAERKAAERQRRADAGLVRLELWAHPEDHAALKEAAAKMQAKRARALTLEDVKRQAAASPRPMIRQKGDAEAPTAAERQKIARRVIAEHRDVLVALKNR